MKVFFEAHILFYRLDKRFPKKQAAYRSLAGEAAGKGEAVISTPVLFGVLCRSHEQAERGSGSRERHLARVRKHGSIPARSQDQESTLTKGQRESPPREAQRPFVAARPPSVSSSLDDRRRNDQTQGRVAGQRQLTPPADDLRESARQSRPSLGPA